MTETPNPVGRYDWKAQPNAGHLSRALEAHIDGFGLVCQGIASDGSDAHSATRLIPIAKVPMAAGGTYFCEVICLCDFCTKSYLAIVARALVNIAARHANNQQ